MTSTESIKATIKHLQSLLASATPAERKRLTASHQPRRHARERVLAYMQKNTRASASEMQLALNLPHYKVANALRDLVNRGAVALTQHEAPRLSGRGRAPRYYRLVETTARSSVRRPSTTPAKPSRPVQPVVQ